MRSERRNVGVTKRALQFVNENDCILLPDIRTCSVTGILGIGKGSFDATKLEVL